MSLGMLSRTNKHFPDWTKQICLIYIFWSKGQKQKYWLRAQLIMPFVLECTTFISRANCTFKAFLAASRNAENIIFVSRFITRSTLSETSRFSIVICPTRPFKTASSKTYRTPCGASHRRNRLSREKYATAREGGKNRFAFMVKLIFLARP